MPVHCTKNHIFFFQMFWKDGLSKKNRAGIWSFLYRSFFLSWKMIFLVPENIILFFRHKTEDDLSQKNAWKFDVFCKCSEKMDFPKNSRLCTIFFVISEKMVFLFSQKYYILSFFLKVTFPASLKKMIFILENMVYLLKHHIDVLDRVQGVLMILCSFMETFIDVFTCCFPVKRSYWSCSVRKDILKTFANFAGKHLCH